MDNSTTCAYRSDFLAAMNYFCEKEGRGVDSKIARFTNKSSAHIGRLRKGRPGSEELRRQIAEFFGYSYEGFLVVGRSLREQGKEPQPRQESVSNESLTLNDIVRVLETISKKLDKLDAIDGLQSKLDQLSIGVETMREPKKKIAPRSLPLPAREK